MALYAIGDFHLSFSVNKPMDRFGKAWNNHVAKLKKYWLKKVRPEDTAVLVGDHSWGRNLSECEADLDFIAHLPGHKILLRGNHDMFWEAKKTDRLNLLYKDQLSFLQNNYFHYKDYALVGTKGYCYEGKDSFEHFEKIRRRELERLRISFEAATNAGYHKYIMFLHYPPTSIGEMDSCFTKIAEAYGAEQVVYAHCHGAERYQDSFQGLVNGIEYKLVSSDFLKFKPALILK